MRSISLNSPNSPVGLRRDLGLSWEFAQNPTRQWLYTTSQRPGMALSVWIPENNGRLEFPIRLSARRSGGWTNTFLQCSCRCYSSGFNFSYQSWVNAGLQPFWPSRLLLSSVAFPPLHETIARRGGWHMVVPSVQCVYTFITIVYLLCIFGELDLTT